MGQFISSQIIGEYYYPDYQSYIGDAYRSEIVFRNVKGLSLVPDYLFKEIIEVKSKLADVTPLYALIKESLIKESFLDYITSEYTLIFYYHASPEIMSIITLIIIALITLGFIYLTYKIDFTTLWQSAKGIVETIPETVKQIPTTLEKLPEAAKSIGLYIILPLIAYIILSKRKIEQTTMEKIEGEQYESATTG